MKRERKIKEELIKKWREELEERKKEGKKLSEQLKRKKEKIKEKETELQKREKTVKQWIKFWNEKIEKEKQGGKENIDSQIIKGGLILGGLGKVNLRILLIVLIVVLIIILYYIIYIMSKDHFAGIWIYDKQKVLISHNRFTDLCKIKFRDKTDMSGYVKNNRIFIVSGN